MIVKETIYTQNAKQVTPNNYFRYNSDDYLDNDYDRKSLELLDQILSQIYAEFLGHSDFNKLISEKYIKIV